MSSAAVVIGALRVKMVKQVVWHVTSYEYSRSLTGPQYFQRTVCSIDFIFAVSGDVRVSTGPVDLHIIGWVEAHRFTL